jgi:hypothetical protein
LGPALIAGATTSAGSVIAEPLCCSTLSLETDPSARTLAQALAIPPKHRQDQSSRTRKDIEQQFHSIKSSGGSGARKRKLHIEQTLRGYFIRSASAQPQVSDQIRAITEGQGFREKVEALKADLREEPGSEISQLQELIDSYNELVNNYAPEHAECLISIEEIIAIAKGDPRHTYEDLTNKFCFMLGSCDALDKQGEEQIFKIALLLDCVLKYTQGYPLEVGCDELTPAAADYYRQICAHSVVAERAGFLNTLMREIKEMLSAEEAVAILDSEKDLVHLGDVRGLMDTEALLRQASLIKEELATAVASSHLQELLNHYQPISLQLGLDAERIKDASQNPDSLFQFIVSLNRIVMKRSNIDYKRAAELFVILANLYTEPLRT